VLRVVRVVVLGGDVARRGGGGGGENLRDLIVPAPLSVRLCFSIGPKVSSLTVTLYY
jgi:hypothetical protein